MDVMCFAVGALAGCFIVRTLYYKKKWKALQGEYDKRCEELTNALGEIGRDKILIESMRESNADFVERIKEYKHLMTLGQRNLKIREHQSFGDPMVPEGIISVIGALEDVDCYFIIKDFEFDNFSAEDREFAIREAEELIETINKF